MEKNLVQEKCLFTIFFSALGALQNSVWVSKAYVIIVMEFNRPI